MNDMEIKVLLDALTTVTAVTQSLNTSVAKLQYDFGQLQTSNAFLRERIFALEKKAIRHERAITHPDIRSKD
jgi:uncharacterized membrane-anchored protein